MAPAVAISIRSRWPDQRDVDPGRLLLRSGVVGHALGGDPPYQRGRRLQPPYAARLVVARRCSVCLKLLAPARSVPAAAS